MATKKTHEQRREERLARNTNTNNQGYVYVVAPCWWQTKRIVPIKIGKSCDPQRRLAELQAYNWEDLTIISTSPRVNNALLLESRLHAEYDDARIRPNNEWFEVTQEELDKILLSLSAQKNI